MNMHASRLDQSLVSSLVRQRGLDLGTELRCLEVTSSTNDVAASAAVEGAAHGLVVCAEQQVRGRGRQGRTWYGANPGESLLCSVLLRPQFGRGRAEGFSLAVGLALRDALTPHVASPLLVKWPNDLYAGEKKVAGILIESQWRASELLAVIVGIGVNLGVRAFPDDLEARSTSVWLDAGQAPSRELLLVDILERLSRRVAAWFKNGMEGILGELSEVDFLRGRRVLVEGQPGVAGGFDARGGLVWTPDATGQKSVVVAGSVEWL